ncbi:MAG: LacI family DNA-binding transcriptional regulator [Coriobacteriales bacterium]|nr:LacI family DNA-binding transcriptional regulator [Coriobacteriales bacterium]
MDINEIARLAGVSRTTVSRYLNDGYVSKQKRELIAQVIEETGYVPSQHAQRLRTRRTGLVGVVIPKINSQSVSRMVAGITEVMSEHNYQVVLANTHNDVNTEIEYLKTFSGRKQVDGIILIATVITKEHLQILDRTRLPLVVLGQELQGSPCVYHNNYRAVYDITSLALKSSRHPGFLGVFEEDIAAGQQRHKGFLDACHDANIEPKPLAQVIAGFDADSGYFAAEQVLFDVPEVDTLVCATDDIAFGAMMCMAEYRKGVPENVQVTGIGDSLLSRIARPSLTTANLHFKTSGIEAAKLLLEQLATGKKTKGHMEISYEVHVRNSSRSSNTTK